MAGHGNTRGDAGSGAMPVVPGYVLVRRLALGGSSEVFLAQAADGEPAGSVAIKVLRPKGMPANLRERFQRECAILAQLEHPNIARLLESGETAAGDPFIAMDYVAGRTLRAWVDEETAGLRQRLNLFLQAAEAVDHAHGRQVVHRDLTMENLLVTADGQAKLIDFGVALPELGEAETANPAPDVYGLGLILRDLVAGEKKKDLRAIVARAAQRKPGDRFATVRELIDEVEAFLGGQPVATYSRRLNYRIGKFVRRHSLAFGTLFALAIVGLAAFAFSSEAGWAAVNQLAELVD